MFCFIQHQISNKKNLLGDSIAIIIESESSLTRIVNESSLPIVFNTFDMLNEKKEVMTKKGFYY